MFIGYLQRFCVQKKLLRGRFEEKNCYRVRIMEETGEEETNYSNVLYVVGVQDKKENIAAWSALEDGRCLHVVNKNGQSIQQSAEAVRPADPCS